MLSLNSQERQDASGIGSGVYVDSVGPNVGFGDRCMSMHDEFAEVFVAGNKFIANPEQVFFFLPRQGYARSHAGMYKQEIAAEIF